VGRAGVAVALFSALVTSACRYDRGELYCESATCPRGDAGTALSPYEAALRIYGDEPACVACVEEECRDLAQACADDAACGADAACRAGCDDNACQYWECRETHAVTVDDQPTHPLEACLIAACSEPCRVGHDFDCVGRYRPPAPDVGQPIIQRLAPVFGLSGAAAPEGLRARVCVGLDPACTEFVHEAETDAEGTVTVEYPAWEDRFGALVPFQGYVELVDPDDPPRIAPQLFAFALPEALPRSPRLVWTPGVFTPDELSAFRGTFGLEFDPSHGSVTTAVYDCRFSDRARAGAAATATEPTGFAGGSIVAVPLRPGTATLTLFHEGAEVARYALPVRAGAGTFVFAAPAPAR
jgi:hypothetical protein